MEFLLAAHYQGKKYWEKVAPTPVGRGLRHGGEVASEAARYAHGNIPRALAWAVPNALYTAAYIPLAAYSLVAKAYNAAWGTQHDGDRANRRHWSNHWKRLHLRPDGTSAPHLPYPGTALGWDRVRDWVPGPDWHAPDYPAAPADPNVFDEHEQYTGMKYASPVWLKSYNEYISNAMLEDAETLGRLIRTDVFPALNPDGTPHPHAGRPRYGNLSRAFQVASLADRAIALAKDGKVGAIGVAQAANAAAELHGFESADEAVALRDAQIQHLIQLNAMHYTNMLQLRLECEEAQHTLDLIIKMHEKDLWYKLKWGYLNYDSAYKSGAEKADNRLRGLLQEVDPIDSRRQRGPFHV